MATCVVPSTIITEEILGLPIVIEFGGGAELLFDKKKVNAVVLPGNDKQWCIKDLLLWIKDNLLKERPELFLQGDSVKINSLLDAIPVGITWFKPIETAKAIHMHVGFRNRGLIQSNLNGSMNTPTSNERMRISSNDLSSSMRRPGILVLVNDADWELMDTINYVIQPNDRIIFISTLHGG